MSGPGGAAIPTSDALVDTSTGDAATPLPAIRAIRDAPPAEVIQHTGSQIPIEQYMKLQWIGLDVQPTWSTGQGPGTKLWQSQIHPNVNQFSNLLRSCYNTWSGGFDWKIKVVGTAFHGGWLAFTRVPPNIPVESLTKISDFTPYETVYVDPKQAECIDIQIMDQRQIEYHLAKQDPLSIDENTPSESLFYRATTFGGTVVMWVYSPLITSSTGNLTINIAMWNRVGESFIFSQITPVLYKSPSTQNLPIEYIKQAIVGYQTASHFSDFVSTITSVPAAMYLKAICLHVENYNLSGENSIPLELQTTPLMEAYQAYIARAGTQTTVFPVSISELDFLPSSSTQHAYIPPFYTTSAIAATSDNTLRPLCPLPHYLRCDPNTGVDSGYGVSAVSSNSQFTRKALGTTGLGATRTWTHVGSLPGHWQITARNTDGWIEENFAHGCNIMGSYPYYNFSYSDSVVNEQYYINSISLDAGNFTPPNGESYIVFHGPAPRQSSDHRVGSTQTLAFYNLAKQGKLQDLNSAISNPLFRLIDSSGGTPAMYLRLNSNGIFSTNPSTEYININMNAVEVEYMGTIRINEKLPVIPTGERLSSLVNCAAVSQIKSSQPEQEKLTLNHIITALQGI